MTSTGSNARIDTQFTMNQASSSCCTGTPYLIVFILTWKRSLEYENPNLSAIIQSFSEALYQISIPYMTDPTIWHNRMPYYSQLIFSKQEA